MGNLRIGVELGHVNEWVEKGRKYKRGSEVGAEK